MTPLHRRNSAAAAAPPGRARPGWTLLIVSVALFMVTLDNLVVTTAIPSIRLDFGASLEDLEWTVNAYTLAYAVLLLPAAALGDRLGRRRTFLAGMVLFTFASVLAALAPSADALVASRGVQGAGAAVVTPLTLTLLADAFPAKRGLAIGIWSGISGLGVALGPLVGGAVVEGIAWQWIFWLNVPIGIVAVPLAARLLSESFGPARRIDAAGVALGSIALLGIVYGIVRGNAAGWGSLEVVASIAAGFAGLGSFVAWEKRAAEPILPMRFFRSRAFAATSAVSLIMYLGIFGSIFLLAQVFQTAQGYGPFEAGLRTLPWTGMPMIVAPIAGLLSDRIGPRPLMVSGLALQSIAIGWIASVSAVDTPYAQLVPGFVLGGIGMALVFAPAANAILASVRPEEAGQASGATNAIREVGGAMGIAVLAAVFSAHGGYESPQAFMDGVEPALWTGSAILAVGAALATLVPGRAKAPATAAVPAPAAA